MLIVFRCSPSGGSVPEVVEVGITGYVVESVEEAICKLGRLLALDRGRMQRRFERRFTADRMAQDYLKVYATAGGRSKSTLLPLRGSATQDQQPRCG